MSKILYRASKAALNSLTRGFVANDVGLLSKLGRRRRASPRSM